MKHTFLLDENILYFAVKGVDEHENPDLTSAELLRLIAENCHKFILDRELANRYWRHIKELEQIPEPLQEAIALMRQLIINSEKGIWQFENPPPLPPGTNFPREDLHVITAALISWPIVVSGDPGLRDAINGQPALDLTALTPREALGLARET